MSVGISLRPFVKSGLLHINSSRPSLQGLEMHLLVLHKLIVKYKPQTVVIDPISSLINIGSLTEVRDMLVRLIDVLKTNNINALFTALTSVVGGSTKDLSVNTVSSLADIWIDVSNETKNDERIRNLRIVKSRGMGHSTEIHKFIITNKGIQIGEPEKKIKTHYNGNRRTEKV